MLNNKFIVQVSNVSDKYGNLLEPFYLGEDHLDHGRSSHDVFEFDTIADAERNCDKSNYITNFADAVFTIQSVRLADVKQLV